MLLISNSVSIKHIYRFILQNYVTAIYRSLLIRFSPNCQHKHISHYVKQYFEHILIPAFLDFQGPTIKRVLSDCYGKIYTPQVALVIWKYFKTRSGHIRLVSRVWWNHRNELQCLLTMIFFSLHCSKPNKQTVEGHFQPHVDYQNSKLISYTCRYPNHK